MPYVPDPHVENKKAEQVDKQFDKIKTAIINLGALAFSFKDNDLLEGARKILDDTRDFEDETFQRFHEEEEAFVKKHEAENNGQG
jgi:hypothetical protein